MGELREFDFIPLKRAAQHLVGKPKAALRFRREQYVDKISLRGVDSDFAGDPVTRKNTTGLVLRIGNHMVKSGSTSELDSPERWRSGVLRSGERRSSWTIFEIHKYGSGNFNEG